MGDFAPLIDDIAERGWSVQPSFLKGDELQGLVAEAMAHKDGGAMRPAGIGRGASMGRRPEIRGDSILWLDNSRPTPQQAPYLGKLEALRLELNRGLFLGLSLFEAHFACYPPGVGYLRHLDRFSDSDERVLSCILYLNRNWTSDQGGQLRLHLSDGPVDVNPLAGTLVVFRSDSIHHEVLPASAPRLSLTGWYRRRAMLAFPMASPLPARPEPEDGDETPTTPPLAA